MEVLENKTIFESPQKHSRKKKVGIELPKLTNSNLKVTKSKNIECSPLNSLLHSSNLSFKKSNTNKNIIRGTLEKSSFENNHTINDGKSKNTYNLEYFNPNYTNIDYHKYSPNIDSQKSKLVRNTESILNDSFYKEMLEKYQTLNKHKKRSCPHKHDLGNQQTNENLYGVANDSHTSKNVKLPRNLDFIATETNSPAQEGNSAQPNNYIINRPNDKGSRLNNEALRPIEKPNLEFAGLSKLNYEILQGTIEPKKKESSTNLDKKMESLNKKTLKSLKLLEKRQIDNNIEENPNEKVSLAHIQKESSALQNLVGSANYDIPVKESVKVQKKSMANILSKLKSKKKNSEREMPIIVKDEENPNIVFAEKLLIESRAPDVNNMDEQVESPLINFSNSIKSVSKTEVKPKRKLFCCI